MLDKIYLLLIVIFIISCNFEVDKEQQLARTHCGSCHQFPEPVLLDKTTWREGVLPQMAKYLGIDPIFQSPLNDKAKPIVSIAEWRRIVTYYLKNAPEQLPLQKRADIKKLYIDFCCGSDSSIRYYNSFNNICKN